MSWCRSARSEEILAK